MCSCETKARTTERKEGGYLEKDKKQKPGQKEGEDGENRERAGDEEKLAATPTGTTVSQKSSPC